MHGTKMQCVNATVVSNTRTWYCSASREWYESRMNLQHHTGGPRVAVVPAKDLTTVDEMHRQISKMEHGPRETRTRNKTIEKAREH